MTRGVGLVLLRHGEAERQSSSDELRRLTERGRAEVGSVVDVMRSRAVLPTAVYSSPYVRARETAEIIAAKMGLADVRVIAGVTPDDDPQRALARLDALLAAEVLPLIVTHMPFIGAVTGLLVDGNPSSGPGFVTAGAVVLRGEVFAPGLLRVAHRFQPCL